MNLSKPDRGKMLRAAADRVKKSGQSGKNFGGEKQKVAPNIRGDFSVRKEGDSNPRYP